MSGRLFHARAAATGKAHVCGQKADFGATIVTIFSHMTRDVSVFVKCVTIFRLFFFGNYHNFILLTFAR